MRRGFATVLTLGLLSSVLLAAVLGLMVYTETVSLPLAVAVVVLINLGMLLLGPAINDFIYGWLYDLEWVTLEEFRERSPASVETIEQVTADYGYDAPKLGVIPDRNPTAFTYGSARYNARIVVTEGCFEFLDDDELASVVAHELGHVTSRDFIVMTLANTIVEVLYLIAVRTMRIAQSGRQSSSSRGNAAGALYAVGVVAFVGWFVGRYAVLYLSRVREYAADGFAADYTDPDDISNALVKIALGIVTTDENPELAQATRNIGIMGFEESRDKGLVYHNAREYEEMDLIMRAFQFDIFSPWAHLLEVTATHPLTGKRVRRLSEHAGATEFDFDAIEEAYPVDRRRLYYEFARDLAVMALPLTLAVGYPVAYLATVGFDLDAVSWFVFAGGWFVAFGLAMLVRAWYKYRPGAAEDTTVVELLGDPYASPVDGARSRLRGELIGRGEAGFKFSADMMFRDDTGLMYLKYDSWLPLLGDLLFSVTQVPTLIDEPVVVEGWYFRSTGPWVGLRKLESEDESVRGFVHLGAYAWSIIAVLIGLVILALPLFL